MPNPQKHQIGHIDGTPLKRMFWSIISDYGLKTGLCELVDNAIDLWIFESRHRALSVEIVLDASRQLIGVQDNAGGVKEDELRLLVAPGGSRNDPQAVLIGIFGVGGKRASIALGEHVEIKTRYKREKTFQIDITKDWLEIDEWEIPAYTTMNVKPGTTSVGISRLRKNFTKEDVNEIRVHLAETYAWFLHNGCNIYLNGTPIIPTDYNAWAYPKGNPPHVAKFDVMLENDKVEVEITAGLIVDRNPEQENYGVYVYCNDRLIVKEYKTRDVGYFVTGEAGVPHPDASMGRAIVRLKGPARHMPWNSSKNGINTGHPVFQNLRPTLIRLVTFQCPFATAQERLGGQGHSLYERYNRAYPDFRYCSRQESPPS